MTTPTQSIQELREELESIDYTTGLRRIATNAIDRLEAAEARIPELQQLMAQGHSKARKHGLQRGALSRELYRTQMVLEGVSADYGDSPMAIQARPPVDDVSGLLDERLKRDAARISELEARQQPRPMADAPRDGVGVWYITSATRNLNNDHWYHTSVIGWLPLPDQNEDES